MKNAAAAETVKRACESCAAYHGIRTPKVCTYRSDISVAFAPKGAWICNGCYGVAMDARRMAAEGNTYAFGESI